MRCWLVVLVALAGCAADLPVDAPAVLLFTRTTEYRHANIESGVDALVDEARERGIRVVATEDPAAISEDGLAPYRAVVFFNTTGDVLDPTQQLALERYIQAGGGFVGIHAAADTEWKANDWPWYTRLVGGAFLGHPSDPSNVQEATVRRRDDAHPATVMLPEEWTRSDEWYDYQRWNPNVRTLLTVDEATYEGGRTGPSHPIAWAHEFEGGRSFYTGLGHTAESFEEPLFLEHLFGGLRWAMGEGAGPPTLAYSPSRVRPEPWRLVAEELAVGIGEPIAMDFTPEGDLYIVERNGRIVRWDPELGETVLVGELDAFTAAENGIGGITFDPGYETNGWAYLYYAVDGEPLPENRVSRFSLGRDGLDLESERVLLSIPIDRGMTSHQGGTLQFGPAGNLWISTGDDTNPHGSGGYSPQDDRPERAIYDSRRTAGNTQSLRGKILRIRPDADGTYTVPAENLFADPADGRPEIYAMGLRNPYRATIDRRTGTLYWGEVGPDAKEDDPTRGPRGYDEVNRTNEPGNFGWPFVIGPNLPYAAYDFEAEAAGERFDPNALRNESSRNDGSKDLPPARPSWLSYAHSDAGPFYEIESGSIETGRTAMVGPVFYADDYQESDQSLPAYYDGKLFLYEFMRDWIKLVSMEVDGTVRRIEPFPVELSLVAPIDLKLAPDGTLYILEYGSVWFTDNPDSRLSRVSYFSGDNPLPVAKAVVSPALGAAPLEVALDGSGSFDRNPDDELRYVWILHEPDGAETEISREPETTMVLSEPGLYEIGLRVTDSADGASSVRRAVQVGNEPPEIRIDLGGNQTFYFDDVDRLPYAISVDDTEDGATAVGTIDSADVVVRVGYQPEGRRAGQAWVESEIVLGTLDPAVEAIEQNGCLSCHSAAQESAGPSFAAIAEKYDGNLEVMRRLAAKVIEGGSGVWGERAMAAQPHVDEDSALRMVRYILTGSGHVEDGRPLDGEIVFDGHQEGCTDAGVLGTFCDGVYEVSATYTDAGGEGLGPITRRESRLLRHPRQLASAAEVMVNAQSVAVPDASSIPFPVPDDMAAIPTGMLLTVARAPGGYLLFEDVDLTGIDSVVITSVAPSFFTNGGTLEVRIDAPDGRLVDEFEIESTLLLSANNATVDLSSVDGVVDLYLVFGGDPEEDGALFILATLDFARSTGR